MGYSPWAHKESDTTERLSIDMKWGLTENVRPIAPARLEDYPAVCLLPCIKKLGL